MSFNEWAPFSFPYEKNTTLMSSEREAFARPQKRHFPFIYTYNLVDIKDLPSPSPN